MLIKEDALLPAVKTNSIFLNEKVENQVTQSIKENINLQNLVTYYSFADTFKLQKLVKETFRYIERCFTMVCKNKNFLQLDFTYVKHILSSSDLDISSEVEVLNAANELVKFDYVKRNKFAKDLLLKVRLPLLSDHALNNVLCKPYNTRQSSVFQSNDQCKLLANQIVQDKELFYS